MTVSVVITGGCGMLGAALAREIAQNGLTLPDGQRHATPKLHLFDRPDSSHPGGLDATVHAVDIADELAVRAALPCDTGLIYHLAAVVSGQAEADPDLAMRVNFQGTAAVLRAARAIGPIPVIGTSSLAVYGHAATAPLTEATPTQPTNTYGVTKAMAELIMADARRRDWVDARTLRLPTVTVRPGKPNAAASSFVSGIIREPLSGDAANCPVPLDTDLWVCSPAAAVTALHHAASVPQADWPGFGAVNVPGLTVNVGDMIAHLPKEVAALITHNHDPAIASIVGGWPSVFDCTLAKQLGFLVDADFAEIYAQAVAHFC